MYTNIVLLLINIVYIYINFSKKTKNNKNILMIYNYLILINIITIIINILVYFLSVIDNIHLNIYFIISSLLLCIITSSMLLLHKKKLSLKNLKINNLISIIFIVILDRVGKSNISNLFLIFLSIILLLIQFILLIRLLYRNRKEICFYSNKEYYLTDIKFSTKIELNRVINHFIYWSAFVVLLKIEFKYFEYVYIIIFLLILRYIYFNIKHLKEILKVIDNNVIYKDEYPSKIHSFKALRLIYRTESTIYYLIYYSISIMLYYLNMDIYISITLYITFLYVVANNKIKLIRHIYSINNKLIPKRNYKNINIKDFSIKSQTICNLKLYNLVYKQYRSTDIIFNPELIINNVSIKIKDNKDYIFDLTSYFM